jgi:hypothetical protein
VRYGYRQKNAIREFDGEVTFDLLPTDTLQNRNRLAGNRVVAGKLALHYRQYYSARKKVGIRWFGGHFFGTADAVPTWFRMGMSTSLDYKKETIFLDRSQLNPSLKAFTRQTDGQDGGFRNYVPVFTDRWLTGLNVSADIPVVPLMAYFDLGTAFSARKIYYGTGFSISLLSNFVQVYLPLAGSNYAQNVPQNFDAFKQNIRFQLQLNALNPFRQLTNALRL